MMKDGAEGQLFALPFYYDTTVPVTDASFEHVVRLELDRYQSRLSQMPVGVAPPTAPELEAKVRAQTERFRGGTLWRLEVAYATPENLEDVLAAVEKNPGFKKWCVA